MTTLTKEKRKLTFQQILEATWELPFSEQRRLRDELTRFSQTYLAQPNASADAIRRGRNLLEKVRAELKVASTDSLDETMASLRGRLW